MMDKQTAAEAYDELLHNSNNKTDICTLVTKWDPMGPSQDRPSHALHLSLVCRKTLASYAFPKFQRRNLIREARKCRSEGNSQARQNNNSLANKRSQRPFVPPQGL